MLSQDTNLIVLLKNNERYIFLYDDESYVKILEILSQFANDSELSFTWENATMLAKKIIEIANTNSQRRFIF